MLIIHIYVNVWVHNMCHSNIVEITYLYNSIMYCTHKLIYGFHNACYAHIAKIIAKIIYLNHPIVLITIEYNTPQ